MVKKFRFKVPKGSRFEVIRLNIQGTKNKLEEKP